MQLKKVLLEIGFVVGITALVGAVLLIPFHPSVPSVSAQGFEPFSKGFVLQPSLATQIIPACTTGSTNCIPNYKQVAHQVSVSNAGSGSAANCGIVLDGSNDNASYYTIGALPPGSASNNNESFVLTANAYFPYLRIKAFPCTLKQTITYVGFSNALPFLNQSENFPTQVGAVVNVATFPSPYLLNSFSCTNNASSAAYLQLFIGSSAPTLGTGEIFEAGIPANQTYTFPGPPLSSYATNRNAGVSWTKLYAGAATAQNGNTAVSTNLDCNFQINPSGPFFPFNAPSP